MPPPARRSPPLAQPTAVASDRSPHLTRRQVLVAGGAGAGALAFGGLLSACGGSSPAGGASGPVDLTIRAMRADVEIGGRRAATWTYGGALPGREVRLAQGKPVRIKLVNDLPEPTSIHWHGIRLNNEADGVPGFTQDAVKPGDEFIYEFTPPDAGTYMLHSHSGTQFDRGLSAPLIVEPRREELSYDREAVLMFDDWTDGLAPSPDQRLAVLQSKGMAMGKGGGRPAAAGATARHTDLAGDTPGPDSLASMANALQAGRLDPGDVRDYPFFLVNGRPPQAPETVAVRRGDRVRLRLINPSADTMYCVWVEGHELEIVRADGPAVRPVRTDAVVLGMGERYDAMVTVRDSGFIRIVGLPLGKRGRAVALLRTKDATGRAPAADAPVEMPRRVLSYGDLQPVGSSAVGAFSATPRVIRLDLAMGRGQYAWTMGGQAFEQADTIKVSRGEHIRFAMRNRTMMPHPMHLHGYDVAVNGIDGPLKDTALAIPMRELTFDWVADNPGSWAFHCHNVYHLAAGMMRKVEVS